MKNSASLKRGLEKVRRHCDRAHYDRAFVETEKLLREWPDNPQLLVMWANLLQLQEADVGPPLEKAKEALQRAVDLDEPSPMPWIELGQYCFALEDDTKAATKYFARAIALSKRSLQEALLCQAKALLELGRRSEALSCLAEAYGLQARHGQPRGEVNGEEFLERLEELVKAD